MVRTVLVVGHSVVYWAGNFVAGSPLWKENLGLEGFRVHWLGKRGMRWNALVRTVADYVFAHGPPDVLVIQLGGNDLGRMPGHQLKNMMLEDLGLLRARLPRTCLIWSHLLERRRWLMVLSPEAINRVRRRLNAAITKKVEALGGFAIPHIRLTRHDRALYWADGVHLSDQGNKIWLEDLKDKVLYAWRVLCFFRSAGKGNTGRPY